MKHDDSRLIDILLPVYNGRGYLAEQVASLCSQSEKRFRLILRDDGSSDGGIDMDMLKNSGLDFLVLPERDHRGVIASCNALLAVSDAPYVMFSDQDDVWLRDKVGKSLSLMRDLEENHGSGVPLLGFCDLVVADEKLKTISPSYFAYQKISPRRNRLNQLLLQNTACGCTMIFNDAMRRLVRDIPAEAVMHDHFFMLAASCFGHIGFRDESMILYRQHGGNFYGASRYGLGYLLRKQREGWRKARERFYANVRQAEAFREKYSGRLEEGDLRMLEEFASLPKAGFFRRRRILLKHRIFKATFLRNLGSFFIV